ncbi:MAG: imidazolonepropionase [Candidatus Latescibacteria bacterium]|nr:imidazolonepropionase [Candidatus Latescibacterota bacterium]
MESCDLLITGASQLITMHTGAAWPRAGPGMAELGLIEDGGVAVRAGRILAAGPSADLRSRFEAPVVIQAAGKVVMPGLVDPHTHLVFAGSRENEFELRLAGISYQEIARRGGGILSTVRATRAASREALIEQARARLDRMLRWGTTTVEAKSGYGLSTADELKQLDVAKALNDEGPVTIVSTFMGAHEVPAEHRTDRRRYLDGLIAETIPRVAEAGLAVFNDVFCETGVFTPDESRAILEAGVRCGLRPKVHADELSSCGGGELAGQVGAISADHLVHPSDAGLDALRQHGVMAVLLPGTSFCLRSRYAPARRMIEMGIPVALATDLNPGSCPIEAMPIIIGLACLNLGLTPAEALTAATVNAACAIGLGDRIGRLSAGLEADLLILDLPDYRGIPYYFGRNPVETVVKAGRIVWEWRT